MHPLSKVYMYGTFSVKMVLICVYIWSVIGRNLIRMQSFEIGTVQIFFYLVLPLTLYNMALVKCKSRELARAIFVVRGASL